MVFAIHRHESAMGVHVSHHPESPFRLPPYPIPLGCPRAPALGALLHASNLHWSSILHTVIYMFQCSSLILSHPCLLPHSPRSDQISCSVVSNSLQPHGLQHTRLSCPSLSPWVCLNSCPLSWWCYPTISSIFFPLSSCPQSFPVSESPSESTFCIRRPKYWSFGNSLFNEYPTFLVEI